MDNLLIIAMLGLLAISVFFGLIVGASRGRKKAFIRLITLVAAFLLSIALTPLISKMVGRVMLDMYGKDILPSFDFISSEQLYELISSNYDTLSGVVFMFANPIVFIAVFIVFWLISLILYWIFAGIFGKRKRDEFGDKLPKKAFTGMLIGILCGFIMFLPTFIPINGYLSLANELNKIEMDGEPALSSMDDIEVAGFKVDVKEYNESPITKAMGLYGLSDVFFNSLAKAELNGTKVVLMDEVKIAANAAGKIDALNFDDLLADIDALEDVVGTVFESNVVNASLDIAIDFLLENPDSLDKMMGGDKDESSEQSIYYADDENKDEENSSSFGIDTMFKDREYMTIVLTELKGNVKENIEAVFDILHDLKDMEISITDFNQDTLTSLDDTQMDRLITSLFKIVIVREMLPFLAGELINPVAEQLGVELEFVRPSLTSADWEGEKTEMKKIFKSVKSLTALMDNSGDMQALENYFSDRSNCISIGTLMEGLRESKLVGQLYGAITKFDEDKDEYVFISYLNDMIFGAAEETTEPQTATTTTTKTQTLRPLFVQKGAEKTGGVSANDNIDFEELSWEDLFGSIADMFGLMKNFKALEGTDLNNASKDDVVAMLESLENMDKDMLQSVLESIVPEDSGFKLPEISEDVDMKKEAEIAADLFDFQDRLNEKGEEGKEIQQEEVDKVVESLAKSDFLIDVLEQNESAMEVSEAEQTMIENALNNPDLEIDADKKAKIEELFKKKNNPTPPVE